MNEGESRQVPFRTQQQQQQQQDYIANENDFLRNILKNQNARPLNNQNRSPAPFEIHRTLDPYEDQFSQFAQPNNRYPLDFIAPPQRSELGNFRNQDFIGAQGSPYRKVEPTASANEIPDTNVPQSYHLSNLLSSKDVAEFPGQKKIKIFLSSQPIYTTPKNLQTYSSTKNFIHDLNGGKYTTAILRPSGNKQLDPNDLLKSFSHVRPFNDYYIPNVPPAKTGKGHHGKKKGDPNQIRYQQEHQKQNNYQEIQKFLNQGFNGQGGGHKHINLGNVSWYQQQQLQQYQQHQKQKQQQQLLQQLQQQNFEVQKYLGNNGNKQQAYGVPKVIPITRIPNIQGHYDSGSGAVVVTNPKQENPNVGKEVFNQFSNLGRPFDYNIKPLTNVQPKPFHKPTVVPPPESVNILGNSIVQTHFQYGVPEQPQNSNYQHFSVGIPAEPPRDVVQGKPYPNIKPIAPPELQQDQNRRPELIQQEIDDYLERPETLSQSEEIALKQQNIDIYRKQNQGNRNPGYNENKRHPSNNNQGNHHEANVNNPNKIVDDIVGQIIKQASSNNRFRQNNADELKVQQDNRGNTQYQDNAPKIRNKVKNKPVIPVVELRPETVTNYPDDAFLSSFQDFLSEYNTKRPTSQVHSSTIANEYKSPESDVKYGFTDTMPSSTQNPFYEGGFRPIKNKDFYQQTPAYTEIYNPTTLLYNTEPNAIQFSNNEIIDKLPPVLDYTPNPQLELKPPKETYTPHVEIFANSVNSIPRPNIENVNPNIQVNTPNDVGIIYQTKKPAFLPTPSYEAVTTPPPIAVTNPPVVETTTKPAKPDFPRKKLKRRRKPGKHRQRYPQGQEDQERRPTENADGEGTTLEYENPTQTYTYDYQTNVPFTTLPSVTEIYNRLTTLPTPTPGAPSTSTTTENSRLKNRSKYNSTRTNRPRFSIKDLRTSTTTTTDKPQTTLDENDMTTTQASKFKIRYRQPSKYATKIPLTENPLLATETTTTPRPKWKPPSTPSRYKSRFRISTSTTQVTSPPSTEEDKEVSASVKIKQKIDLFSKRNHQKHKPIQEFKDNANAEEETSKDPEISKELPKKIKNIYSSQRRHPYLLNKKTVTPPTQDHNTLDDQMPSPSSAEEIVDKLQHVDATVPTTKEEVVKNEPDNENLGVLSGSPHEINEFINSAEDDDDRTKHRGSSHGVEENPHAYVSYADRENPDNTRVQANEELREHDYILPIIRHYSREKYSNHKLDKDTRDHPDRKNVHENIKDIISSDKSKDYKDEDAPPNLTIVKAPWDDLSSMFDDINVQSNGHSQKPFSSSMRETVSSSLPPPEVFDAASSAAPARKKISSKISFTTEDPILPIEAFFQFAKRDDEK